MKNKLKNENHENQNNLATTLFEISDILNTPANLDQLFESIYTQLNQLFNLPEFYIALYKEDKDKITLPFMVTQRKIFYNCEDKFSQSHALTKKVLKTKKPLTLYQDQLSDAGYNTQNNSPVPQVFVGIPLRTQQKTWGVLAVQHFDDPDYFTPEIIQILHTVANQICLALEKNQYFDELDILQNYLFNIINSMPSILIVLNKKAMVTQWNLQAELETCVKEKDALGKPIEDVFPRISKYSAIIHESVQFNRLKTRLRQHYTHEKETRFEDVIIYPLITRKEEGVVIRIDDITDQVRLEEMMIQSEKMLSIGGLAAGMAHEINNPIAGMMQTAQVIYNRLSNNIPANEAVANEIGSSMSDIHDYADKRQILEKLDLINETGTRAAEIIRNMLGFARKSDTIFKSHDIAKMLIKTLKLLKNDYNLKDHYNFKTINTIEDFDTTMPPVLCDKSKLQQVFFNLLKNGAEAMFNIKDATYEPQFIFRLYKKDNMACIELENNGPLISKEEQLRLFEPFFTTKPVGQGTGLGLSLSYFIIVKDHKGEMMVESSPETNTRFTIKLPC